ncbi:ureidoglycolate lyase [Pseudorhodobacter sp.]|uniref:ureidoglycolate lyase n=1 Tax=Pseudorhodobacter sp. TaxID=1934400 RepID=UPI00264A346D|nr:ureidoglycolate lyase [Pseudorhodobacter sp.]MDN5787265.1 ureidoglycolate lyase [Pseudorhodobacter sp.]
MTRTIQTEPLTAAAFAPFGEVLEATGTPEKLINKGKCGRFHDRAKLDFADARAGISVFLGEPCSFPYDIELVERHPEGSQAFLPMTQNPFLVVVTTGVDAKPRAFLTNGAQGINLHRGVWHGVLTPLAAPGLFGVVDRIGTTPNLEEHHFELPWTVTGSGLSPASAD